MSATVTVRLGPFSGRLERRYVLGTAALVVLALGVGLLGLMLGTITFPASEVLRALTGHHAPLTDLFVLQWRLPRVTCALVLGAMLGVAGAMFQVITRNPLGSPDVIGFTTGSHTGGLLAILLVGNGFADVATGSVVGGLLTALAVFALARSGAAQGYRLVLAGIGLTSMLASLDTYLVLTADPDDAMVASVWGVGSLNGVTFGYSWPALALGGLLVVVALGLADRLRQLELGDDFAASLGTRPDRTRLVCVLVGVGLVALTVAVIDRKSVV